MGEIERPDLCEQIGVAVSASALVMDPEHAESHLVRIAAMGAAANRIARNLDAPIGTPRWLRTPIALDSQAARQLSGTRPAEDRDRIEARLAPLLWRMKAGGDASPVTALEAVRLFALWLAGTFSWRKHPVGAQVTRQLAARVIHEWLADRCPACVGTGLQELLKDGRTRRPLRYGDADVRLVQCRGCGGSMRAHVDARERARVLQVSLAEYRSAWAGRMQRAAIQLRGIAARQKKPLRVELERDYNRV